MLLQRKPWTFEGITKDLIVGQFRNIVDEGNPPITVDDDEGMAPDEAEEDTEKDPSQPSVPQVRRRQKLPLGNGHIYPRKMPRNSNIPGEDRSPPQPDFEEAEKSAVEALYMCEEAFFTTLEETPDK